MKRLQVIPAVDLMSGRIVRLTRGDLNKQKEYGDPMESVKRWVDMGAEMIHIVDLDATFGKGNNRPLIEEILSGTRVPVQVGGGIRNVEAASGLLEKGIARIILGSLAFREPEAVSWLVDEYGPERIVVSVDHSTGRVKISGWMEDTGVGVDEALDDFRELGAELFLVTCIDRDGTLTSPDTDTIRRLAGRARIIAAGGVSALSDLSSLKKAGAEATVIGKALYEARFTLHEAKEAAR